MKKKPTPQTESLSYKTHACKIYNHSCLDIPECKDNDVSLTITSPPYWNAIDYDLFSKEDVCYRQRLANNLGKTYEEWLDNLQKAFSEVYRVTIDGGFCAIVIGTILFKSKHYPAPFHILERMEKLGWNFHQDIIWNKVTGGIKRAGTYIQHPKVGYYYPNIMTEYILIFRKGDTRRKGQSVYPNLPIDNVFKRDIANNIWHIAPIPPRTIAHPCPYPEELVRRLVLLYSDKDEEILDPFLGSGQTARVALRNFRYFVGYEIDKRFYDLTIERLYGFSNRKYQLLPKMETFLTY